MSKEYNPKEIENKWQEKWEKSGIYNAQDNSDKYKYYSLIEFPYPSGDGLHVGHPRPFIGMDVISRKRRMQGFNVLYPIGWDAFGLPTENYAIKTGKDPRVVTKENSDIFRKQIKSLGISFDWSREINTTDPEYYKWTQWIFLKFLERGLAYKAKTEINWCPKDKIGLANEEVIDGRCERCGTVVEKREKEQWILAITKYADRLYDDLDGLDYPDRVKTQQRNWIGKSEGAEIEFGITNHESRIKIFTTRPDTIFGATYLVLAPEHELIQKLESRITNYEEIKKYAEEARKKTDIERSAEGKGPSTGSGQGKTGVELKGVKAINPATKEEIPVWIADYVLPHYGTGAIMAVPAHDERDFEFARKYDLEIRQVIAPHLMDESNPPQDSKRTVPRVVVQGIVRHWKENQILQVVWKDFPWKTFVIGGAEYGESLEDAVKREILEETGYKNVESLRKLGLEIRNEWYAEHKDENRYAHMHMFEIILADGEQIELSDEERAKHDLKWIPFGSVPTSFHPVREMAYIWDSLNNNSTYPKIYTGSGILINSGKFSEKNNEEVKDEIIKFVGGEKKTTYKLRDWIFSRQRYWGEPIPVIHCDKCGIVPVPEKDLPVELPQVENYQPTDTGESPLANISEWVNVDCPKCGGKGKRETDVMPNWAGSSWYFLRYCDPHNDEEFASMDKLKYWLGSRLNGGQSTPSGVDWYNGGMEHTTLHLLYSRFWHKFLYDLWLVPTSEPYRKRTSHGLILAEGGEKMSKSKGNVINPDEIVERFGADTLRLYEMFMGPFEQAIAWSEDALVGPRRFLEKAWRLKEKTSPRPSATPLLAKERGLGGEVMHGTIKKVTDDIEVLGFNTAISALMIFANSLDKRDKISSEEYETLLRLLAPFAPHMTEEIWHEIGHKNSIHLEKWPEYDPNKLEIDDVTMVVQIDGKVRASFSILRDEKESKIKELALSLPQVKKWLQDEKPNKVIVIPNKIISIVQGIDKKRGK